MVRSWHGRARRALTTGLLMATAFAAGSITTGVGHADPATKSPYAPLTQLSRVLVFIENQYVDPVQRQKILDGAIKGMVRELDPHSDYMSPKEFTAFNEDTGGSFGGIGVEVDFKDDHALVLAPIPGSPAARAGVKAGDRIVAVGTTTLRGLSSKKIVDLMRGPPKTKVKITVVRHGVDKALVFDLTRENVHVASVEPRMLTEGVGYLRLRQFQDGTTTELVRAVATLRRDKQQKLAAVVLDMRNNPGGLIDEAQGVADEMLKGGAIYSTRHRGKVVDEVRAKAGGAIVGMPLVVLVNEYSASSAELVAGALQDHGRADIVGTRTFGKGSVQTIYGLPGGAGLRLTTMRYYTPKGRAIQVEGIDPDIAIELLPDPGGAPPVLREGHLAGHLSSEKKRVKHRRARRVLKGGTRQKYRPIGQVAVDPYTQQDFALRVAHGMMLKKLGKTPPKGWDTAPPAPKKKAAKKKPTEKKAAEKKPTNKPEK